MGVFFQRAAQLLGTQQLLQRHLALAQPRQFPPQPPQGLCRRWFQVFRADSLRQTFQQSHLHRRHPGRGVAPPRIQPAHLQAAVREHAKITVAHRHAPVAARRQKGHPAVDPIQSDGQPRAPRHLGQQRLKILRRAAARLLHPQPVHIQMQHRETQVFRGLFGAQQRLAPPGRHSLMRLNPPKPRVFVAQIAKAHHQQPLLRRRARPNALAARVPGGQPHRPGFQRHTFVQQRGQRARDQAGVGRGRLGERARLRLRRNIAAHHHRRVQRNKINRAHFKMQPHARLVHQPPKIGLDQAQHTARLLHLLFVPGNQHPIPQRGLHLHAGNPRARRNARRGLNGQSRHPRVLQNALQPIVAPQHGVLAVNVHASIEMHLLAAVHDLPIGKIGVFFHGAQRVSRVAAQRRLPPPQQFRQQPGIAVIGQHNIWIQLLQSRAQPGRRCAARHPGVALLPGAKAQLQAGRRGALRVALGQIDLQNAQRRRGRVQRPGGFQHLKRAHIALFVRLGPAARQRKRAEGRRVPHRQRHIRVVIGQVGEFALHLRKQRL